MYGMMYKHILLTQGGELRAASRTIALYKLLPSVECVSPRYLQATKHLQGKNVSLYHCGIVYMSTVSVCVDITANCVPMDETMYHSPAYQRVYQYLRRHIGRISLDRFHYKHGSVEGSKEDCLEIMLQ